MFTFAGVREVHLELTARCNASCPQCPRNDYGGPVNPELPLAELSLDDVRAIFPPQVVAQLEHVFVCGNYGDAMVARDALECFAYLRAQNPAMRLMLDTNGSGRTPEWWSALAKLGVRVRFGIDGLEDTNHLYRRGAQWARVMDATRAFIAAGGDAVWSFIVFRHNEHQVEAAKARSVELGFREFIARRTYRFASGDRMSVRSRDGAIEYDLEMPIGEAWQNRAMTSLVKLSTEERRARLDGAPIECQSIASRHIYVSAEGLVFPCCHTGHLYARDERAAEMNALVAAHGGKQAIDARRVPLATIVEGPLFRAIAGGWSRSLGDGRLGICATVCGATRDMFSKKQVDVRL